MVGTGKGAVTYEVVVVICCVVVVALVDTVVVIDVTVEPVVINFVVVAGFWDLSEYTAELDAATPLGVGLTTVFRFYTRLHATRQSHLGFLVTESAADLLDCTASEPPTPPPIAPAHIRNIRATRIQNVTGRNPHIF